MFGKPDIARLGHVAKVLPMPLSEASRSVLNNTFSEVVYLDRTKSAALVVQVENVFAKDEKQKAFVIVPSELCLAEFIQYILNSVPVNQKIDEARTDRSLSVAKIADLPIPFIPLEKQEDIVKLYRYYTQLSKLVPNGDMDAALGATFLYQVSVAMNTELFFPFICSMNNIRIYEHWMSLLLSVSDDAKIIANEILKPGNRLMAEVRSLQRVMANAQKSITDAAQS